MFKPNIQRINDIKELRTAEDYKRLRKSLEDVKKEKTIDSEMLKGVLNITGYCSARVHCFYHYLKKNGFKCYIITNTMHHSGQKIRGVLEEIIGGAIRDELGEQAFKEYDADPFEGFNSMIKWIKYSEKNKVLGINMNLNSGELIASYSIFIRELG